MPEQTGRALGAAATRNRNHPGSRVCAQGRPYRWGILPG